MSPEEIVYMHRLGTNAQTDVPVFGYRVLPGIDLDLSDNNGVSTDPRSEIVVATVNPGFANEYAIHDKFITN